jgi:3-oxoacyl-[acyl-carrier-protein] synthase II
LQDLPAGLLQPPAFVATELAGRKRQPVCFGRLPDFSKIINQYAKPLKRRKMSRLSRMAVCVAGLALAQAGFSRDFHQDCGVILGTAFGSTGQSELFYLDMLDKGFLRANPGLFPETVPNAPAGQVSITFGLGGANTTICRQSLSSELALMTGYDLLQSGKLEQAVIIGIEEISTALLSGLWACGSLQKKPASFSSVPLGKKMIVGEAAVALVLESEKSVRDKNITPLAKLSWIDSFDPAIWPARFCEVANGVQRLGERVSKFVESAKIECLIPAASFIKDVDSAHFSTLTSIFGPDLPMLIPEYHTGALLGGGLLKQALGVILLGKKQFSARRSGKITNYDYDKLYKDIIDEISTVYTSAITPGGGCCGVLLEKVN